MGGRKVIMTENRYGSDVWVNKEYIERSQDMALVEAERKLIAEVYERADFPRDFRVQIRHEDDGSRDAVRVSVRLTPIDPTNPRVEKDPAFFRMETPAQTERHLQELKSMLAPRTHSESFLMGALREEENRRIRDALDNERELAKAKAMKELATKKIDGLKLTGGIWMDEIQGAGDIPQEFIDAYRVKDPKIKLNGKDIA
jgi:hypothetical protein